MKNRRGFATVYIVLILFSLMTAIMALAYVASVFASRSIAENICTSAGESILGEYNVELYKRYGVFALRSYDEELSELANEYLMLSSVVTKGVDRPYPEKISVYSDSHPALNTELFAKQLLKLTLPGLIKSRSSGQEHPYRKIKAANLPSKLLGFKSRESVLLSGGIFDIKIDTVAIDEYIVNMCSDAVHKRDDTYLAHECEYILFGYSSDEENLASMRRSLFAALLALNLAKAEPLPTDPVTLAIATAEATVQTEVDIERLLNGESVDGMDYDSFLHIFLGVLSRSEKLARLMDIMQVNVNYIDGSGFSFVHYCYGFDLKVEFSNCGIVEQTHLYK